MIKDVTVDEFKREMSDRMTKYHEAMQELSETEAAAYVQDIFAGADIVLGIYADETSPDGYGMIVLKGEREMREIAPFEAPMVDCIPCLTREQAIALKEAFNQRKN